MRPACGHRAELINDRQMPLEFKMILLMLYGKFMEDILKVRIIDSVVNHSILEESRTITLSRTENDETVITISSPLGKVVVAFKTSSDISEIVKKLKSIFFTRKYKISTQAYLKSVPDIQLQSISVQG